jgi:predicted transcriptional regulator
MTYHPDRDGLERFGLGPREAAIMEYMWDCCTPRTLRHVCYYRSEGRAVTTVQTTLNRLVNKGLLKKVKDGREHYHYSPIEPRAVWEARQLAAVRESLG